MLIYEPKAHGALRVRPECPFQHATNVSKDDTMYHSAAPAMAGGANTFALLYANDISDHSD